MCPPECRNVTDNVTTHVDVYRADAGVRPYRCGIRFLKKESVLIRVGIRVIRVSLNDYPQVTNVLRLIPYDVAVCPDELYGLVSPSTNCSTKKFSPSKTA